MPLVEIAGLRRVAIALFGYRQRDDANGRISHPLDQRGRLLARHNAVEQRADDAMLGAFSGAHGDCVKMILRGEGIARIGAARACADDAPGGATRGKAIVDDDSLVGAMKRAETKMHNAGRDARTVIGRAADGRWHLVEIGVTKPHGRLP